MENFEIRYILTRSTLKELKWHLTSLLDKWMVMAISRSTGIHTWGDYEPDGFYPYSTALKRAKQAAGKSEIECVVNFSNDKITSHSPNIRLNYADIKKLLETESQYVLITKSKKFIAVNKASLIAAGKNEDFICFIKDKCKNVRWRGKNA